VDMDVVVGVGIGVGIWAGPQPLKPNTPMNNDAPTME